MFAYPLRFPFKMKLEQYTETDTYWWEFIYTNYQSITKVLAHKYPYDQQSTAAPCHIPIPYHSATPLHSSPNTPISR